MKILFTAKLTPIENSDGFYASIPDLDGCATSGNSLENAIEMITDALNLYLVTMEDLNENIPTPTPHQNFISDGKSLYTLIQADTVQYRKQTDIRSVRKNVSIPAWMDNRAKSLNLNISQVLQDALSKII